MGLYQRHILPFLLHHAMKQQDLMALRRRLLPAASGRVLEVGIGSGLNLPLYGSAVASVLGIDPSNELLAKAAQAARALPLKVDLLACGAEDIPAPAGSFDTVVTTWTLCTIPGAERALKEMRRLLKPDGRLLFVEHGHSPEPRVAAWQDRLNPLWTRCAGGCNMNRPIDALIRGAGFRIDRLETGYMVKGPRPLTYLYEGMALRD